ncbi:hypothetical protein [Paraburkholderia sp. J67]|uniref:hypothetical protein n=1 Tax=Paraburkholderia sp. J67 TaxID=2805435 RepID=UPI002ABDFC97|nr:hypothetical protein [Paraburkholderia sp. J67]
MFQVLLIIGIVAAPYLWNDAVHATGVNKYLWITGGLTGLVCTVVFLVWAIRLNRSQKIETVSQKLEPEAQTDRLMPVGVELANAVAERLDAGNDLAYGHAYYCGMGLTKYGDSYVYASVQDGEVATPEYGDAFFRSLESDGGKIFESRAQFIEWLSAQTDSSLYGDGNQNITLKRLQSFASLIVRS